MAGRPPGVSPPPLVSWLAIRDSRIDLATCPAHATGARSPLGPSLGDRSCSRVSPCRSAQPSTSCSAYLLSRARHDDGDTGDLHPARHRPRPGARYGRTADRSGCHQLAGARCQRTAAPRVALGEHLHSRRCNGGEPLGACGRPPSEQRRSHGSDLVRVNLALIVMFALALRRSSEPASVIGRPS
jgi:hypothetical protein